MQNFKENQKNKHKNIKRMNNKKYLNGKEIVQYLLKKNKNKNLLNLKNLKIICKILLNEKLLKYHKNKLNKWNKILNIKRCKKN